MLPFAFGTQSRNLQSQFKVWMMPATASPLSRYWTMRSYLAALMVVSERTT